jgi:hypothetical protein
MRSHVREGRVATARRNEDSTRASELRTAPRGRPSVKRISRSWSAARSDLPEMQPTI